MNWRWPLISAYFGLRGEPVGSLFEQAQHRQYKSQGEIAKFQRLRLARLLEFATQHVPAYKGMESNLDAFPVLSREMLHGDLSALCATGFPGRHWAQYSGGSTGEPAVVMLDSGMHAWRVATGWRGDCFGGLQPGFRGLFLWGHRGDMSAGKRLASRLRDWLFNTYMTDAFILDASTVKEIQALIQRLRPQVLAGYSSALIRYSRLARQIGLSHSAPVKVMPTADLCTEADSAELAEYFGAPVMQRYGAREVGDLAHQCERGVWHIHSDHVLLEVKRDDGSITKTGHGELLVTCLSNRVMPIIRYAIGDQADLTPVECSCGRGLPTFTGIKGRVSDFISLPGGKTLSSLVFNHLLRAAPIQQFQIIQDAADHIRLLVVPLADYTDSAEDELRAYIAAHTSGALRMSVHTVESIEPTRSGKLRQVVREGNWKG